MPCRRRHAILRHYGAAAMSACFRYLRLYMPPAANIFAPRSHAAIAAMPMLRRHVTLLAA